MKKRIITIGRQYGSGGRLIGEAVAKALGFDFYNRNMIDMIAEKSGLAAEYITNREDKISSRLIWAHMPGEAAMSMLFAPNYYTNSDKMFFAQSEIIKELAEKGNCVIVGRCADYILNDRENCLKVFIYGDKKDRVTRVVDQYGVEAAKAAKIIDNTDSGRAKYYNHYTEMTWGDCRHYNLCIDSTRFGIDGATELIVNAVKQGIK
ncbi:MAG: cytidylate kinase-like family protein [Clostridia bacterium]|nr:cytidylate kinase-like family protein [Clostridia bacterium]